MREEEREKVIRYLVFFSFCTPPLASDSHFAPPRACFRATEKSKTITPNLQGVTPDFGLLLAV